MLEFIVGRAGTGKTEACLSAMQEKMEQEPMGPALILLVPEHMTYKLERRLAARMSQHGHGFARSYVFGFRRFARQVLLETGGAVYPRITDIGKRLLLKKILDARQKELAVFGRAAGQRGFTDTLAAAIEELKSYGIAADRLAPVIQRLTDQNLQAKLQDLSLLYEDFSAAMQGRYTDAEDTLEALARQLPSAHLLDGAEVWLDGFVFFNPQEKKILQLLLERTQLHITLTLDPENPEENVRETGLFYRSFQTQQEVQAMAAEAGTAYRVHSLTHAYRFRAEALSFLEKHLFQYPLQRCPKNDRIQLVEAANRRLEIEAAAVDMVRLCREQGYHWRDIGVLIRDQEAYGRGVEMVLQDYGIPFFRDSKRPGIHHPLTEFIRSAFEILHGWRYEPIFRCIRTEFFPITRGQADQLENYVLQFGIQGRRWLMDEDWSFWPRRSLEGGEEPQDDRTSKVLAEINLIRRQVIVPLQHFALAVKAAAGSVSGNTEALYALLMELHVTEKLASWSAAAEQAGHLSASKEHQQIWDAVLTLLEQFVETSGTDTMPLKEYESVLNDGLDGLQLSLIPPGLDYVTLASFDQNSLDNVWAIYVLGANEGIMPRHNAEHGIFSDADRLHLKEAGLLLPFGSIENSFAEKYQLYRGFTRSRDYFWLSYALADTEGKGQEPASLLARMKTTFPGIRLQSIPLESLAQGAQLPLAGRRPALSRLAGALRSYREHGRLDVPWADVYNWALQQDLLQPLFNKILTGLFAAADEERLPPALARSLYVKGHCLRGSVTKLETFNRCPFAYYAQYGLRLQERREYSFQAMDLGNLLHAVLSTFGAQLKRDQREWADVSSEECRRLCRDILANLAPKLQNEILLSTAQYQNLLERICRAAEKTIARLSDFDKESQFRPFVFEQEFGGGANSLPPLVYELKDGLRLEIVGRIDRIDTAETNQGSQFLILDYKTGNAYLNLWEIYYGLNLQLLTYLLVAETGLQQLTGKPSTFAGMLYCFLRSVFLNTDCAVSEEKAKALLLKELRMPGWVVANPETIRAIDAAGRFIKVTLNKDGLPRASQGVRSPEEFDVLLNYMEKRLKETGENILSGTAAARPYRMSGSNACTYCKYHAVCGFDLQIPGFRYEEMEKKGKPDEALAAMRETAEKEAESNGVV